MPAWVRGLRKDVSSRSDDGSEPAYRTERRNSFASADASATVTDHYKAPFRFTGTLHKVTVDLSGELISDPEAELRVHMARQ